MTPVLRSAVRTAGRAAVARARAELLQAGRDALEHGAAVSILYDQLDVALRKSNVTDDGINERLVSTVAAVTRRRPAALVQVLDELHGSESDPLLAALAADLERAAIEAARQLDLLNAYDLAAIVEGRVS